MAEEDTGTLELEWRLGMGFAMSGCEVLTYWVGPRLVPLTPPLSVCGWNLGSSELSLPGAGSCQLAASPVSGASAADLKKPAPKCPLRL